MDQETQVQTGISYTAHTFLRFLILNTGTAGTGDNIGYELTAKARS